jgi:hypothetical protein
MRRFFLLSPVLALACGGTIGPVDPGALHIEGSYDLVVSDVQGEPNPEPYPPPSTTHPAVGEHARLDIHKNGASYEAALTPEFGDATAMTVSFGADGTVTLAGDVAFSGGASYASVTDDLSALHFAVGGDGHFTGSFSAEGTENVFEGDVGWQGAISASGTTGADARPPTAQISPIASAQGALLPWDTLYARMSEPVDGASLAGALSLTPGAASWQVQPAPFDWIGATTAVGYRTSWSDFAGDATLSVAAGLADPSGNVSAATATPTSFLAVPQAASFDGATLPAMWGVAAPASTSESCGAAGSCVEIGPLDGPCSAQAAGIAGRIGAPGAGKVSITFRVRAASQYGQPYMGTGLGLTLATPGQPAQPIFDGQLSPALTETGDATYPYASDWTTAVVKLPQSGAEIGFSIVPFGEATTYCGGGPALPPVTVVVDVAQVTAVP